MSGYITGNELNNRDMEMENKLPVEFKQKWIEALRSGVYEQGKGYLMLRKNQKDKFCCLGVVCVIAGIPKEKLYQPSKEADEDNEYGAVEYELITSIGDDELTANVPALLKDNGDNRVIELTYMNDGFGKYSGDQKSFSEIADYIEKEF